MIFPSRTDISLAKEYLDILCDHSEDTEATACKIERLISSDFIYKCGPNPAAQIIVDREHYLESVKEGFIRIRKSNDDKNDDHLTIDAGNRVVAENIQSVENYGYESECPEHLKLFHIKLLFTFDRQESSLVIDSIEKVYV